MIVQQNIQEPVKASIWHALNHYQYRDAIFLAERLFAEVGSEDVLHLLATCHYRSGKPNQALAILNHYLSPAMVTPLSQQQQPAGTTLQPTPQCKLLKAQCLLDMKRYSDAKTAVVGSRSITEQHIALIISDVKKEFGDTAPFVLNLLAKILSKENEKVAAELYKHCLKLNPLLWSAFEGLCKTVDDSKQVNVGEYFTVDHLSTFNMCTSSHPAASPPPSRLSLQVSVPSNNNKASQQQQQQHDLTSPSTDVRVNNKINELTSLSTLAPVGGGGGGVTPENLPPVLDVPGAPKRPTRVIPLSPYECGDGVTVPRMFSPGLVTVATTTAATLPSSVPSNKSVVAPAVESSPPGTAGNTQPSSATLLLAGSSIFTSTPIISAPALPQTPSFGVLPVSVLGGVEALNTPIDTQVLLPDHPPNAPVKQPRRVNRPVVNKRDGRPQLGENRPNRDLDRTARLFNPQNTNTVKENKRGVGGQVCRGGVVGGGVSSVGGVGIGGAPTRKGNKGRGGKSLKLTNENETVETLRGRKKKEAVTPAEKDVDDADEKPEKLTESVKRCSLNKTNLAAQTLAIQKAAVGGLMKLLCELGRAYQACWLTCDELYGLALYRALEDRHQNTPWVLAQMGRVLWKIQDNKMACKVYEKLHTLYPYHLEDLDYYSSTLWHLRQEVELSALSQELTEFDWAAPQTWVATANTWSLQKEHDRAVKCLHKAIKCDSECLYAYILLGQEYLEMEELDRARNAFRDALNLDAKHFAAWFGLGSVFYKQEKFREAILNLKKAAAYNPNNATVKCHLACALHSIEKDSQALQLLDQALSLSNNQPLALFKKASILLFSQNKPQEALQALDTLKEIAPNEALIYFLMGKAYRRQGATHLALMNFQWASELDPKGSHNNLKEFMDKRFPGADDDHNMMAELREAPTSSSASRVRAIGSAAVSSALSSGGRSSRSIVRVRRTSNLHPPHTTTPITPANLSSIAPPNSSHHDFAVDDDEDEDDDDEDVEEEDDQYHFDGLDDSDLFGSSDMVAENVVEGVDVMEEGVVSEEGEAVDVMSLSIGEDLLARDTHNTNTTPSNNNNSSNELSLLNELNSSAGVSMQLESMESDGSL